MTESGTKRPRIVAFAYACTPGVGSEGGAGWIWARLLAGLGETWVLTRPFPARRRAIASELPGIPERDRLHVVYVEMPGLPLLGRWASGRRLPQLQYIVWQLAALREARRLHRAHGFDLSWHLTYANIWMGAAAALVGPPFVNGPVGGGVQPPWRLVPAIGARGALHEVARVLGQWWGRTLNPLARVAWQRARLILVQNEDTREWLPASERSKAVILQNVVLDVPSGARRAGRGREGPPTALYAGRLLPLKGMGLGIRAIARLPGWRLVIYGSGPDEQGLRRLAEQLGVSDRVSFMGWRPREEVLAAMTEADVFLLPCLHEEAGWAVAEAVMCGLPAVSLDRGGPPVLGVRTVSAGWPAETVARLAEAVELARREPAPPIADLSLAARRARLATLLKEHGVLPAAATVRRRASQPAGAWSTPGGRG